MRQIRAGLESMSPEDLWSLHGQVVAVLTSKISAKKADLERKLCQLKAGPSERRSYPPVQPKYRNPMRPSETWSGRGKKPRWVSDQLQKGKRLENFRIRTSEGAFQPIKGR